MIYINIRLLTFHTNDYDRSDHHHIVPKEQIHLQLFYRNINEIHYFLIHQINI